MDDDKTLRTAVEAIMAARRDELGEPPRPDELLAYRDGTLPPAERTLVEEKIAAFPEATAALLDLARFPDVAPAPGVRQVTDEEIAADWQQLRARRERERQAEPAPSRTPPRYLQAAALAAALLLGALGGLLLGRGALAPAARPTAGTDLVALAPDGSEAVTRSETATIAAGTPHLLLLAAGGVEPLPAYSLAIHDASGRVAWSQARVSPTGEGLVTVLLPAGFLPPGSYRLSLSPPEGGEPLATYTLVVEPAARP